MNDQPTKNKSKALLASIYDFAELFVIAICVVVTLFTFGVRLCTVDGNSMYDTLEHQQMLVTSDIFYTPENGDIIVFHQSDNANPNLNKPLVKRIIATEGQYLKIRYVYEESSAYTDIYYLKMEVWVSNDASFDASEKLDESYIDYETISIKNEFNELYYNYAHYLRKCNKVTDGEYVFETQVPDGSVFVMGDNRFGSDDSRLNVGFVDNRCILGKVAFRISPFGKVQ